MSQGDSDEIEAPQSGASPQASYFYERPISARKINMEREGKINFAARVNLFFAVLMLANATYAAYKITQPIPQAKVIVQYFSNAGVIREVKTVSAGQLPPPRQTVRPAQVIIEKPADVTQQKLIDLPQMQDGRTQSNQQGQQQ